MNAFWVGMAIIALIVVMLFAVPLVAVLLHKFRRTPSGVQHPTSVETPLYKQPLVWIIGFVVLGILWVFASYSTLGVSFWVPWFLIVMLAVLGVMGKAGGVGKLAGWFVGVLLFGYLTLHTVFGNEFNDVVGVWRQNIVAVAKGRGKPSNQSAPQQAEPRVKTVQATWNGVQEDASIPINVWSQVFSIGVGCKTDYDAGNGTDFKVRYRLYSPEWKDHPGGENYPPANEVQFMLLKPRSTVPVKVTCS